MALGLHSRAVLETQGIGFFFFLSGPTLAGKDFFSMARKQVPGWGREERNLENRLKTKTIFACTHTVSGFILVCFT